MSLKFEKNYSNFKFNTKPLKNKIWSLKSRAFFTEFEVQYRL